MKLEDVSCYGKKNETVTEEKTGSWVSRRQIAILNMVINMGSYETVRYKSVT